MEPENIPADDFGDNKTSEHNMIHDPFQQPSNKTSTPKMAGILLIVAGVITIIHWIFIIISSEAIVSLIDLEVYANMNLTVTPEQLMSAFTMCGTIAIILSIFTLIGGILAFKKKTLGLVITGGIFGIIVITPVFFFISNIISLIGVILVVVSRKEFQ